MFDVHFEYVKRDGFDSSFVLNTYPQKFSELINDMNFVDVGYIDTALSQIVIPTKVSELENDSDFVTKNELPDINKYQLKITPNSKLYSDLVDDENQKNKFVTQEEKYEWNNKQNYISDIGTIRSNSQKAITAIQPEDLSLVATSGNYNDLINKPNIPLRYGTSIVVDVDPVTYKGTVYLRDQNNNTLGDIQTFDLPLESVVVGGYYDEDTKSVVLTIKDGSEVKFSVADLTSGLQAEITNTNKLSASFVDDSNSSNKFVSQIEKNTWNNKQDYISDLNTIRANANKGATAIQLENIPVQDVKVNNISILSDGIANIPIGSNKQLGLVMQDNGNETGIVIQSGVVKVYPASTTRIDSKTGSAPIVPSNLDYAVQKSITTNSNTLSADEKSNACDWLGATKDVQVNNTSVVTDGVANIPYASTSNWGVVKTVANYGINANSNGQLHIINPSDAQITNKSGFIAVTCSTMDKALKNSITTNTIELTDEEKTNACNWIGAVKDVQANGTSIITDGIANIPVAGAGGKLGLIFPAGFGINVTASGALATVKATDALIEAKTNNFQPVVPSNLDYAVKVGVTTNTKELTTEEKANACNWLGAEQSAKIQELGTTDSITLTDNTVYNGGELTSLVIAVPDTVNIAFICNIEFTSGATPTTLQYPDSLKWIGDDITDNVFTPTINKRYSVICYCNGVDYICVVKGV